ncbi:MAG: hypothetical protein WC506_06790 [Candidatus Micrarchaeia archaeon]
MKFKPNEQQTGGWERFKSIPKRGGRKYGMFERRMMQYVMPYNERFFAKMYKEPKKAKEKTREKYNPATSKGQKKIKRGFLVAKLYGVADIALETLNFALIGAAVLYFFHAAGTVFDSTIRTMQDLLGHFGIQADGNGPKYILVGLCSISSKLLVKVGCWVEMFQMFKVESLARKSGAVADIQARRQLGKYSGESIREQFKDMVVAFLVFAPFVELLRRKSAIVSELRQLRYIGNLERLILKKKEPVAENVVGDKP